MDSWSALHVTIKLLFVTLLTHQNVFIKSSLPHTSPPKFHHTVSFACTTYFKVEHFLCPPCLPNPNDTEFNPREHAIHPGTKFVIWYLWNNRQSFVPFHFPCHTLLCGSQAMRPNSIPRHPAASCDYIACSTFNILFYFHVSFLS